jgi:fructokinase
MTGLTTSMGESLIDFLPIQEGGRTVGFRMHPGGSPFNVAVGLARLGRPTAFASKISSDLFGRYLREYLESQGIDTRFLVSSDAQTTLAFVATEDGEPAYAFYNEGTADTLLLPDEVPTALFDETAILHFGSISLLSGTTPSAVLSTVERLRGRALLSFDPNLRPGLVRDEAGYRALLDRLFGMADVLKLSASDLQWLSPGSTVEQAADGLAARGPALLAITRGAQGVLAMRGGDRWEVPATQVRVVDAVGAGDAFSSGLLAGLFEHGITSRDTLLSADRAEIADTLAFATAVSAITCTRAGANPPTRQEVAAFARSLRAPGHWL